MGGYKVPDPLKFTFPFFQLLTPLTPLLSSCYYLINSLHAYMMTKIRQGKRVKDYVLLQVYVPTSQFFMVRELAHALHVTMSEVIRRLLNVEMDKRK